MGDSAIAGLLPDLVRKPTDVRDDGRAARHALDGKKPVPHEELLRDDIGVAERVAHLVIRTTLENQSSGDIQALAALGSRRQLEDPRCL